jgi:hypothetical protein
MQASNITEGEGYLKSGSQGSNHWTRSDIVRFEQKIGLEPNESEIPAYPTQRWLEDRYSRSAVTIWRWVKKGYLPAPRKIGVEC